jgi:hypothetical protein
MVHGGDRLPWVKLNEEGDDNFTALSSIDWQLHIYGEPSPEMRAACTERNLPLQVFRWRPDLSHIGLLRNAAYLVRPDGYVALADDQARAATVTAYLDRHRLRPAS